MMNDERRKEVLFTVIRNLFCLLKLKNTLKRLIQTQAVSYYTDYEQNLFRQLQLAMQIQSNWESRRMNATECPTSNMGYCHNRP